MINHARTLLLNVDGPHTVDPAVAGDVFIPSFNSKAATSALATVRATLFGTLPDYAGLVYRTAQYMDILHATDFKEYVYALDPRITYTPGGAGLVGATEGYTLSGPANSAQVFHAPAALATDTTGRLNFDWMLTKADSGTVNIAYLNTVVQQSVTFSGGVSSSIYLPGSNLCMTIFGNSVPAYVWQVHYTKVPAVDLGAVSAGLSAALPRFSTAVFGDPLIEPYLTFYNLATSTANLPLNLSGFLLGYIYRSNESSP
ncbi:MAG: hypothetical protein D0530_04820 [Methylococcales bacterium]|nr:MAG: hypothetical protein D0530_04820 [Methylococcales bacterium]